MRVEDLDTPALVVDLDRLEANLERMAQYARAHGLRLRPHTKTHKAPWIGQRQLDLGAVGLTVAKSTEAEVMLAAGPKDLLVAYPVVGAPKLERLRPIAEQLDLTIALDSLEAAEAISRAGLRVRVLVEMDVGLGRVGVRPEDVESLVRAVEALPGITWGGLAFYPGHIKQGGEAGRKAIAALSELVGGTVESLRRAGLEPRVVSGGSTPTWNHSHEIAGMNEMRPGTYVFNDRNSVQCGSCAPEDCAAHMLVTVVSTAREGTIIIDAGSKTFSSDRYEDECGVSFGAIAGAPGAHFYKMNEEHGFVDTTACERKFRVGEKLLVLMNHVCVAMNLAERVHGYRGGRVEKEWAVVARGKLQ
ncbi:MAG: alanine racemase [Bryobacter sp.]|nr:alanine racemase [Bryobacter sp.]